MPDLTAAENIMLGNWPSRLGVVSQRRIRQAAQQQLDRFGVGLDIRSRMSALRLGDRQVVEICKVLGRRAPYVVLDEPAAALDRNEADRLFAIVRRLAEQNVGVVFISHRLDEISRFSDRVDVMRNGRRVASLATRSTTGAQLIELMLGGEAVHRADRRSSERPGRPALQLSGWTSKGPVRLDGVDLEEGAGEIVGVFGVRGAVPTYWPKGGGPAPRHHRRPDGEQTTRFLETAYTATKDALQTLPADHHLIVYGVNDDCAHGAWRAITEAGRDGDPLIAGLSATTEGLAQLRTNPAWIAQGEVFIDVWGQFGLAVGPRLPRFRRSC